MKKQM